MGTDDDLAPQLEELAATLEDLRGRLDEDRPRRLRDLLRFTEQYTIPAVISILETNIRLLELTAGAIRLADGRIDDHAGSTGSGRREAAVDALDRALDDLGGALRGDPTDPEARQLLEEARQLRRDVRGRLATERDGTRTREGSTDESEPEQYLVPVEAESGEGDVDVDAELETIKREVHGDGDEGTRADDAADGAHSGEN